VHTMTGTCYLRKIASVYGSLCCGNEDLVTRNPGWSADSIFNKVGIESRRIVAAGETALDLAEGASRSVMASASCDPQSIDCLILVTQSPDYLLPSSACILQHRLGLRDSVAAFDVGLGCSGFNYGLWLGRALIRSQQTRRVLLVCAETYSRYCDPHDISTVTLFGDGAAAVILQADETDTIATIGESVLGTDGSGAEDLIVSQGGARSRANQTANSIEQPTLRMDGPSVFRFALDRVKNACDELLGRTTLSWADIDVVLCHQANRFMLQTLQRQFGLDDARMPIDVRDIGNLSAASLPVHIARWYESPRDRAVKHSLAVGFGVGFSWGATHIQWH